MVQRDPERYTLGDDGQIVEKVGRWAVSKLKILTDYVHASGGARRKYYEPGTAFIDVFSGPGRSMIKGTNRFIDGSPIAAFKKAENSLGRFTSVNVSDADEELLAAAEKRLRLLNAPVQTFAGPASVAMPKIVESLNPYGLHLAFLDPHNLGTLSFDLFEQLAKLKRVDVIVHVSLSDLQRNADRYTDEAYVQFDKFVPGWRGKVSTDVNQTAFRAAIIKYWCEKILELNFPQDPHWELIKGIHGQRLYWLVLLARNKLANKLWADITSAARQPRLF